MSIFMIKIHVNEILSNKCFYMQNLPLKMKSKRNQDFSTKSKKHYYVNFQDSMGCLALRQNVRKEIIYDKILIFIYNMI